MYLIDRIAAFGVAKAVRRVGFIVVHLRLGVMVGRVARPLARETDHLAQHEIGVRRVPVVKNRAHDARARLMHGSLAAVFVRRVAGQVEPGRERARVVRAHDVDFALVRKRRKRYRGIFIHVQRRRRHVKAVFAVLDVLLAVKGKLYLAVDEQICLFQPAIVVKRIALFHAQHAEIHQHIGVRAVHFRNGRIAKGMLASGAANIAHLTPPAFR